ncbi:MAG: hypothetical protein WBK28_00985 [Minisyncoccia bacterium]
MGYDTGTSSTHTEETMTASAHSITVVQGNPARAFQFGRYWFHEFPLRVICPKTRENLMMSAARCAVGATIWFKPGCASRLVMYLKAKTSREACAYN